MASLRNRNGIWLIEWGTPKKTISLGRVGASTAELAKAKLQVLLADLEHAGKPSAESAAWIKALPKSLRLSLQSRGVLTCDRGITLGDLFRRFEAKDRKDSTAVSYGNAIRNLREHFGESTPLDAITSTRAADFVDALRRTKLASSTVNRRIIACRTIFNLAVASEVIDRNPFKGIVAGSQRNPSRKQHVAADVIRRLIAASSDTELRTIIALSRFGGLRVPSEVLALRWSDIDWNDGTILVRSPKTEHHAGQEQRIIPIFADLYPYLREAFEAAEPGAVYVVNRMRQTTSAYWRKPMLALIAKIGVKPWPKLFHNLRASCETDLCKRFRVHLVATWMGHRALVAFDHYLTIDQADIRAACAPLGAPLQVVAGRVTEMNEPEKTPDSRGNPTDPVGGTGRVPPNIHREKRERAAWRAAQRSRQLRAQRVLAQCYSRAISRSASSSHPFSRTEERCG